MTYSIVNAAMVQALRWVRSTTLMATATDTVPTPAATGTPPVVARLGAPVSPVLISISTLTRPSGPVGDLSMTNETASTLLSMYLLELAE